MTTTTTLYDIHRDVSAAGGSAVLDKPEWRSALMVMNPDPDSVRRGDRWVETRSQRLGKRDVPRRHLPAGGPAARDGAHRPLGDGQRLPPPEREGPRPAPRSPHPPDGR